MKISEYVDGIGRIGPVAFGEILREFVPGIDVACDEVVASTGCDWTTEKGKLVKRLRKELRRRGFALSNETWSLLGKRLQEGAFVRGFHAETVRFGDLNDGDFFDEGSCYRNSRMEAVGLLEYAGAFVLALRDKNYAPEGRCWVMPLDYHQYALFNAYGESLSTFAGVLARVVGAEEIARCRVDNWGSQTGLIWINHNGGRYNGYVVGPAGVRFLNYVNLDIDDLCGCGRPDCRLGADPVRNEDGVLYNEGCIHWCNHCGERFGGPGYGEDCDLCEFCYDSLVTCDDCGRRCLLEDTEDVSHDGVVCDRCFQAYKECDICGEYVRISSLVEADGVVCCPECLETIADAEEPAEPKETPWFGFWRATETIENPTIKAAYGWPVFQNHVPGLRFVAYHSTDEPSLWYLIETSTGLSAVKIGGERCRATQANLRHTLDRLVSELCAIPAERVSSTVARVIADYPSIYGGLNG